MTKRSLSPNDDLHWVEVEPSPRWVRVKFNGQMIAGSRRVLLLREKGRTPVYYFPADDVNETFLHPTKRTTHCPYKGDAAYWSIQVGERVAENAVWSYQDPLPERRDIAGYKAFYWHKLDHWYEEETEVFVHARDPYVRVDVLPSSRHVQVIAGGQIVADSRRPALLFETGLPTRYYLPQADVRMDLLEPTGTLTRCPYKGQARYWSVRIGDQLFKDLVWSYPDPIPECPGIKDLVCFFNERVEAIYVDGELEEKPQTKWS